MTNSESFEEAHTDIIYLAVTLILFGLSLGLIELCDRL